MTQPAKSQEPSMEEILASIRRIIADDDAAKTAPPAPEPARPAPRPVAPPPVAPPRSFTPPPPPPPPPPEPVEPPPPEIHAEFADAAALGDEDVEDSAADILDLTEFDGGAVIQSTGAAAGSAAAISQDRSFFGREF